MTEATWRQQVGIIASTKQNEVVSTTTFIKNIQIITDKLHYNKDNQPMHNLICFFSDLYLTNLYKKVSNKLYIDFTQ